MLKSQFDSACRLQLFLDFPPKVEYHSLMNEDTEMVTITKKEYESLKEDSKWLEALQRAGVDNWEGYDFARELFNEE